ncbi:hypothetical protein [Butyrivibrio sp. XPD2006]|uniref:hypothetical protein n=1 Tax=Butyrivibrio sp. XPD2006 TaxID=1280668 RepID=UPI0003B3E799|nr:hypothetical protein [Butyrivibrio sp. XPD2006]
MLTLIIVAIGLTPVLFILWVTVKTIVIMAKFISFDIRLASIKRSNPELYKQMKREAFLITNANTNAVVMWNVWRN